LTIKGESKLVALAPEGESLKLVVRIKGDCGGEEELGEREV